MHDGALAVLNAGSATLKFALFDGDAGEPILRGMVDRLGGGAVPVLSAADAMGQAVSCPAGLLAGACDAGEAALRLYPWLSAVARGRTGAPLRGIGHRIVHGGQRHAGPARATEAVVEELAALSPFAPLHQPHNLAPVRAILRDEPHLPQVLCFDTAFHRTQDPLAERFALPAALHESGVRRYGFHGLSYEGIAAALPGAAPELARPDARVVAAHLGSGASLCALRGGRSVTSTMGFSTLDGLPMATRCGALDPGVLLYLLREKGMSLEAVERMLYRESGLLGVSGGIASDMRDLRASEAPEARRAIDLFAQRIVQETGRMAATLGGIDALVFTGGIGLNDPELRDSVCRELGWLGLEIDAAANAAGGPRISTPASRIAALVLDDREDGVIARQTFAVLEGPAVAP